MPLFFVDLFVCVLTAHKHSFDHLVPAQVQNSKIIKLDLSSETIVLGAGGLVSTGFTDPQQQKFILHTIEN